MKNLLTTIFLLALFISGVHFFSSISLATAGENKTSIHESKSNNNTSIKLFLNSIKDEPIEEPRFIGMKEDHNIGVDYLDDKFSVEYIQFNGNKLYKMNVKRIYYTYYDDSYDDNVGYTYGNLIGNLWCSLDEKCYRTGIMESEYGDLILEERIPYKERNKYTTQD